MKIESTKKKFNTWLKGQYNNSDAVRIVWIIDEFDRYCLKAGYRNSSIYNINNYEELLLLELNSMGNNSKLNNYWINYLN
jgi:hypothetical protein